MSTTDQNETTGTADRPGTAAATPDTGASAEPQADGRPATTATEHAGTGDRPETAGEATAGTAGDAAAPPAPKAPPAPVNDAVPAATPDTGASAEPQADGPAPDGAGRPAAGGAGSADAPAHAPDPAAPGTPPAPGGGPAGDSGPDAAATAPGTPAPKAPFVHRRWARAVARWTVAAVLCGAAGTGAAVWVTGKERTDVPGLATAPDGRWSYPVLELPQLAEGELRPFAQGNAAGVHYADPRGLLLPAPEGATAHADLPDGGWIDVETYASRYGDSARQELTEALSLLPLRHIAARGWEMPDGTSTEIYLLRFTSEAVADAFYYAHVGSMGTRTELAAAPHSLLDETWPNGQDVGEVNTVVRAEPAPRRPGQYTDGHTRLAYLQAGDTLGLVVQSHPDEAAEVPFHQTVILQSQLLG